jgi:putative ABC transport system permease protein
MFRYYFKLATLSIRANPVLSVLMVAAIAIGIGACMTIMTVRHVMSGNPIEHKNDQLYHVQVDNWNPDEAYEDPDLPPEQLAYLDAKALHGAGRAFRQTTSFMTSRVVQPEEKDGRAFQEEARATTADFFPMFDVPFLYGSGWDRSADETEERVKFGRAYANAQ